MMRPYAILLVTALVARTAPAQPVTRNRVPVVVRHALQVKFPAASGVAWKIKSDRSYEAEFTLKQTDIAVKFDSTGKWLETESAAPRSAIPAAVRDTVARRFKGYVVVETQMVERWNERRIAYELHLQNATEVVKVQFGTDGAILNQSAKPRPAKTR